MAGVMNPVIREAWQRVEDARLIIERAGGWRLWFPNAWCQALMHLKRHVHIPAYARTDWAWLTNEMGRSIESRRDSRGMQFMACISDSEVRDMYYAFRRIYCCIANLASRSESKGDSLETEPPLQAGESSEPVSYDFEFRVH
jgi:hypothetical protein